LTVEPEPEPGCPFSSEIVEFLNEQPVPNFIDPLAGVDPSAPVATSTSDPIVAQDNISNCEIMNPAGNSLLNNTVNTNSTHSIMGIVNGSVLDDSSLTLDQALTCADEMGCSNFTGGFILTLGGDLSLGGSFLP